MARPGAFILACLTVLAWAVSGPMFHYSETWQLVINTGTTIITFLMVFLIQNTQNRDSKAMHLKLDELLRALHGARNEMIDLENVSEEELQKRCQEFAKLHEAYRGAIEKRHKRSRPTNGKRKPQAAAR